VQARFGGGQKEKEQQCHLVGWLPYHLQGGACGSATLKRFFQEQDQVRLQPANTEVVPILIPKNIWDQEWEIQGKVVAILRPC
jgi:repressor LexA